ncbi:hypothetical protein ACFWFQ_33110 [Nocardia salmonicida]|uniref:hypothetical protein n=1 Tax=Nocardia salmonicida TaxID=53431 RepID=UPI003662F6EF
MAQLVGAAIEGGGVLLEQFGRPTDPRVARLLENRWNNTAVRHYDAAEPSHPAEDVPLYIL